MQDLCGVGGRVILRRDLDHVATNDVQPIETAQDLQDFAGLQTAHFRKISFTGSNATGARVMAAAAQRAVPVLLELGGKSPLIVLDDANISEAVDIAAAGIFFNCGQMCSATSRLLVADKIADDFIAALVEKAGKLAVGGYENPDAEMGPLTTAQQFAKVKDFFAKAEVDGLNCLIGGKTITDRKGYCVEPTIYRDVPLDHPIWQEEIFGPVLALRSFTSADEAVALANDTDFGLAATVIGTDKKAAVAVARRLEAGHVWVNTFARYGLLNRKGSGSIRSIKCRD